MSRSKNTRATQMNSLTSGERSGLLPGILGLLFVLSAPLTEVRAEGSAQIGLNQSLLDFDQAQASNYYRSFGIFDLGEQ